MTGNGVLCRKIYIEKNRICALGIIQTLAQSDFFQHEAI